MATQTLRETLNCTSQTVLFSLQLKVRGMITVYATHPTKRSLEKAFKRVLGKEVDGGKQGRIYKGKPLTLKQVGFSYLFL